MKRSLKLLMSALTALVVPALGWAAAPVATWANFDTLTSGNFTVNFNTNTYADGYITMGGRPVQVSSPANWDARASGAAMIVAMKVSNISATTATQTLISLNSGNRFGVVRAADGGLDALYDGNPRTNNNGISTAFPTDKGEYTIVFKYSDYGTQAWAIDSTGTVTKYVDDTACKDKTQVGALTLLGASYGPANVSSGMRIHNLAIWNTDESIETVAAYLEFRDDGAGAEYTATISEDVNLKNITWTKVADSTTVATDALPEDAWVKMTVTGTPTITVDADDTPPQVIAYADNPFTVKKIVSSTDAAEQASAYIPGIVSNPSWQIWDTANTCGAAVTCTAELDGSAIDGFELVTSGGTARLNLQNTATLKIPSFGVNFYSGADTATKVSTAETAQGILPMPGTAWNDVQGNVATTPVTSLNTYGVDGTISVSDSLQMARVGIRQWKLDNTPPSGLQKGYIDDSANNPTTLTFTNIPYSQYRVIVYMSTDTTNYKFEHVTIGGVDYTAGVGTTASATIPGSTAWGDSGPNHNANALAEGVNLLVSPVLTASECAVSATRTTGGPRATIAAIQVVDCTAENRILEQKISVESDATVKVSDLGIYNTDNLILTLKPGAVLTMDATPTLREFNIISEGTAESPATVLTSVDNPFANAESAKITGGETKIPAAMYFSDSVNLSALDSVTLVAAGTATADAPQTIETAIDVANGKTVKLEGYFTLSGANQVQSGGTLVINSGKTTLTTDGQGIKGTVTIAKGATLTNATTDGLAYETAGVIVNVYGTLDLNTTRWTIFANNNTLNLYAGATVTGAGEGTKGAVDVWEKESMTPAINVLKNSENAADVTISAELRCREGKTVFNIAEGMTAVINNNNNPDTNGGGIKVTGAGTLKITSANTYPGGTIVDADATLVVANTAALGSGAVSGSGTLIVDGVEINATANTEFTGSYGVQNGGTLIVAAGKEGAIEVPNGATVKIVLNEVQYTAGYTAAGVTGAGTIAFYKEGDLETQLTAEGNIYGGSGKVWTPTAANSAWDTCWNVSEVPTSGEIAINTSNLEADIVVTIPDNFTKITVNAHAEYTTAITFGENVTAAPLAVVGKVKLPIAVINGVDVAVATDAILIADVAEEATLTKALSGSYAFWKAGEGTLILNANVTAAHGTEILAGTLKFGVVNGTKYTIGGTEYGTQGNVKVYGGAVLDVNGVADAFLNMVTLCEGAVFANDGASELSDGSRQLKGITLEGDATVRATSNFGILASGHNQSTLNLGGKTLTKTGTGSFWLSNTDVSNGTLKVEAGKFTAIGTGDKAASFTNVTFDTSLETEAFNLGTGNISGTVTKKGTGSLTLNGVISGSDALTVEAGTLVLTAANTRTGNVTIASGATLDVSGENARLLGPSSAANGHLITAYITLEGTLRSRDWNWRDDKSGAFSNLAHNPEFFTINGGTVEITETITSERKFTIGVNGATFKTANDVIYTNSGALSGSNPMTIAAGSVVLSGGNGGYNGKITIAEGASLATSGSATVPFGKGTIENNGTLTVGGTNGQLPAVSGAGNVNITAQTRIAGDITTTGTLTIGAAATMTYYTGDFTDADLSINGPSIVLNGSLETTNDGSSVTVASGKTISGTGTLTGDLTLANGATVEVPADGILTVTGMVTWPTAEGEKVNFNLGSVVTTNTSIPLMKGTENGTNLSAPTDGHYAVYLGTTDIAPHLASFGIDANILYARTGTEPNGTPGPIWTALQNLATTAQATSITGITLNGDAELDAVALFTGVATATAEGVVTVNEYDFGVSGISVNAARQIVATVKVTGATEDVKIAQGVTLELYNEANGVIFGTMVGTAGGEITITSTSTIDEIIEALKLDTTTSATLSFAVRATTSPTVEKTHDEEIQTPTK